MQLPKLQNFIHQICEDLEIEPKPTANEKKEYELSLNEEIELYIVELEEHAFIRSLLVKCPEEKREELFIYLMRANFLGQGTGGGAIGVDENENFLTLSLIMPYELNYIFFKEKIEDFVNYVFYLREEIEKFQRENQASFY